MRRPPLCSTSSGRLPSMAVTPGSPASNSPPGPGAERRVPGPRTPRLTEADPARRARDCGVASYDYDLLIRGGTVVDGTGALPRTADVAVEGGRVVDVGTLGVRGSGGARQVVDADGALVMPGFVDIHTHYDGQATWDERLTPSSWLGVTTVVMGNCGVGFAPCRPEDRQRLIELMEGVEDIPSTALHEGLPWTWTSFPEYLDHLSGRSFDIDLAAQVPHGAVRLHVMGERGAQREPATVEEIGAMGRIAR